MPEKRGALRSEDAINRCVITNKEGAMRYRTFWPRLMRTWLALGCMLTLVAGALRATPAQAEKWHTDPTGWGWLHGVTAEQISNVISDEYRLIDVEVEQAEPLRFSVAFVRNAGVHAKGWWWYYGLSAEAVSTKLNNNDARIIDLESYWVGGQQRFAVIMVPNTGANAKAWWWYYNVSPEFIGDKLDQNNARLIDIDTFVYNGTRYYTVVMIKNAGADAKAWWWYYNVSPQFIGDKLKQNNARLIDIEKHGADTFTVIMEKNDGKHWWWYYGLTAAQVGSFAGQNGARVFDVEPYEIAGQQRFAVLMLNNANELTTRIGDLLRANTDAVVGLRLKRVNGPVLASLQSTTPFYPASTIKVLQHLHAMRWVQIPIPNNPNPLIKLGTPIPIYDDSCAGAGPSVDESLSLALSAMMKNSNNARTNAVQDYFGQAAINATAHDVVGMSADTQLNHKFGCGGPTNDPANRATLADLTLLYERVARGELLGAPHLIVFHDLMLNESDDFFISSTIDQEAAALGLSASKKQEFKAAVKMMHKAGSIPPSVDGTTYLSLAGWVGLPFKSGGQTVLRGYVYGIFIDQATSVAAGFGPTVAARELLRDEIHNALKSWTSIIGTLQPGQASQLSSGDGKLTLEFPAGAVNTAVDILHQPLAAPTHPLPANLAGHYHFELDALDEIGEPVTQFAAPYNMRLSYEGVNLAAHGIAESKLRIAYWDGEAWVIVPSSIDRANKRISATLNHFSEFALVSSDGAPVYLPIVLR
jgi:hypothetical protein